MKYIRKIDEAQDKEVTKKMWDRDLKNDFDKREELLLTVFDDPDDAEKWIDAKYDDLPPQASHMYTEKLKEYPLAKEPFHGSPVIGKEIGETKDQEAADEIQKKKEEEELNEASLKSNIMQKWDTAQVIQKDLQSFIDSARDAGGEDLINVIYTALKNSTEYARRIIRKG
jgi:hypothetical protein